MKMKGNLLDKSKKSRKADSYCFKEGQKASRFEQVAKEAEEKASSSWDQMTLLSNLVGTLKAEYTKAFRNGVGFVISSL